MLIIKKEIEKTVLIQNNDRSLQFVHLLLGIAIVTGIFPPVFILIEAPLTLMVFSLLILLIQEIKYYKIPKKIFINLTKEKIEIKKKKQVFTLSYESIKEIVTIEEKGEACLKILTNDGIYEIETIFREDAEIMKKIILEQRKELNEF